MHPLLSVIVPIHNAEPYLRRCLDSILAQTMTDMEVILVENGSKDQSLSICEEYVQKDARCKMVKGNFADPSRARNLGISMAVAPYIAFVDSDDYIEPEMYETLLTAIENRGAEMALSLHLIEYENGDVINCSSFPTTDTVVSSEWICRQMLSRNVSSSVWIGVWPRKLFEVAIFPPDKLFEDHRCTFSWCLRFSKIALVHKAYYHYNKHQGSTSRITEYSPRHCRDFFEAEASRLEWLQQYSRNEADKALQLKMATWIIGYISNYLTLLSEDHEDASKSEAIQVLKQAAALLKSVSFVNAASKIKLQAFFITHMPHSYTYIFRLRRLFKQFLDCKYSKNEKRNVHS